MMKWIEGKGRGSSEIVKLRLAGLKGRLCWEQWPSQGRRGLTTVLFGGGRYVAHVYWFQKIN